MSASPENPLRGRCLCGAVRFEVRAPFISAGYCHCHRCQRRSGGSCSASAQIGTADLEFLSGAESIRSFQPEDGKPKAYCGECGGALFAGSLDGEVVAIRLGAIEGDPGIRPERHQWVNSAATWEEIPDDGLPRYDEAAP